MTQPDTYLGLCTEVYDLSKPKPPIDSYKFYRSYAANAQGKVLEPMCGTGRFLLPLLEEGFPIQGFDASAHMLAALHKKAKQKNLIPDVWQGYVADLSRQERYRLIFIPTGSFCLLVDDNEVKNALKLFYNHLETGGILLFEASAYHDIPSLGNWRGSGWTREDGKKIILSQCASLEGNICSSIQKYELIEHNKILNTEVEELKFRFYKPQEILALLEEVSFKQIRTLKAFDTSTLPDEKDEIIIYECKK